MMIKGMLLNNLAYDVNPKSQDKASKPTDDLFADIFKEKLDSRMQPALRASYSTEKAVEPARKTESHTEKPLQRSKPESTEDTYKNDRRYKANDSGSFEVSRKPDAAQKTSTPESTQSETPTGEVKSTDNQDNQKDKTGSAKEDGAEDSIRMAVLMLQELLAKLNALTENPEAQQQDLSAAKVEGLSSELQKVLESLQDPNLKALLENVAELSKQPAETLTAFQDMLKGLVDKVDKLQALLPNNTQGLTATVEVDQTNSLQALISKLKSESAKLLEKISNGLNTQQTSVSSETAALNVASTSNESENLIDSEPEADQAIADEGSKTKAVAKGQDESSKVLAMNAQPKQAIDADQPKESQNDVDYNTLASKPLDEVKGDVKAAKVEFQLSPKPLAQSVTNQVMLKVKLMAGEQKQEMEMHLKPESLGKLTLKIVHERGEILAKITAESEQVKSILESNMQLLKDALEKSGLSVQSLNVSVGGNNGKENQQQDLQNNHPNTNQSNTVKSASGLSEADIRKAVNRHTYFDDTSKIDLTA